MYHTFSDYAPIKGGPIGQRVNGVLIPHGGGSIAIIGGSEDDLTELERSVVDSVEWSI